MNLLLFIVAWLLIPILTYYNRKVVKSNGGDMVGYGRSTALSLDIWACKEFRSLWTKYLIKPNWRYKFGVEGETISSCLGKAEHDKWLTTEPQKGVPKWFYGKKMVEILNNLFEENHCKNSIDLTKGDWYFEPE